MGEQLTIQLSNFMHVAFLSGIIFASLIRLTDGRRDHLFERFALLLIAAGAFFQLAKKAHPQGTGFEILILHGGVFLWLCSQVYVRYHKRFSQWISK